MMGLHWTDLARLEATGGAVWRKHEQLVEQAHGAQPGSAAALALLAFEADWMLNPTAVKAACEAEEEAAKPEEDESKEDKSKEDEEGEETV